MIEPKFFYSREKITDFKILDPDNKHEIFDLAKKCHSVDYKDPKTNLYYFTSIYNKFYENGINLGFMEVVDGIGNHYIVRDDRIIRKIDYTISDEFEGDQLFCMVLNNTKMPRYSFVSKALERQKMNAKVFDLYNLII